MNNEDYNKRIFLTWTVNNWGYWNKNLTPSKSAEQLIAELDLVDEVVDSMEKYPTAERMLSELWNK